MATKNPSTPNGGAKLEDLYRGVGIKAVAGAIAKDGTRKAAPPASLPKPKEKTPAT